MHVDEGQIELHSNPGVWGCGGWVILSWVEDGLYLPMPHLHPPPPPREKGQRRRLCGMKRFFPHSGGGIGRHPKYCIPMLPYVKVNLIKAYCHVIHKMLHHIILQQPQERSYMKEGCRQPTSDTE